jgi:hypothetical protein
MIWTLIVLAQTPTGPSLAIHDFQTAQVCVVVKRDIERQMPGAQAACIPKFWDIIQ